MEIKTVNLRAKMAQVYWKETQDEPNQTNHRAAILGCQGTGYEEVSHVMLLVGGGTGGI